MLKSDVTPSFRQTADPHKPWICLDVNGNVLTAHCNCMAGYDKLYNIQYNNNNNIQY